MRARLSRTFFLAIRSGEEEIGKESGLRAAIEAAKQDVERRSQARARQGDPMLEAKQPNECTIRRTNPRIADVLAHIESVKPPRMSA